MALIRPREYDIMEAISSAPSMSMQDFGMMDYEPQYSPADAMRGALPRIAQMQGPPPITYPIQTGLPMQQPEEKSMADLMREFYQPKTVATDRFNQHVDSAPTRNKPGIARRLAASAAALGAPKGKGIETAEQFMYAPYARNTQDWMQRMDPYHKAATLENTSNANERQLAASMATATMNERKQTEVERKNREQEKISQQRANVYQYKAENPNAQFNFTGPTVKVMDPATGQVHDTGIPTGNMTQMDRINLQGRWGVERARVQGANQQALENTRQQGRDDLLEKRGWQIFQQDGKTYRINPTTNQAELVPINEGTITRPGTPPRGAGAGGNTPSQAKVDVANKARELQNKRPDLGKWIVWGQGVNEPRINPKTPMKEAQEINRYLYGSSGQKSNSSSGTSNRANGPTVVKKEHHQGSKKTRITYSDGTVKILDGIQ